MKLFLILIISFSAMANFDLAPNSFYFKKGKKAVFIDIKNAKHEINYDTKWRSASSITTINFVTKEDGYPLFDLVPRVRRIYLDGQRIKAKKIKLPHKSGKARVMKHFTKAGEHRVVIYHKIRKIARFGVKFGWFKRSVDSGFFIRDLKARRFLEQFLPTNLEYDQYPIELDVRVSGTNRTHTVIANGKLQSITNNHFKITYPDYYTASSVYFHVFPKGKYQHKKGFLNSITGKKIPLYVYAKSYRDPNVFYTEAQKIFKELEADYGAYGHDSLIIFATGRGSGGGMEFSGAMTTTLGSLDHELLHSYFAKGVMPANGNSGWLDEAIASWRDYGYQRNPSPTYGRTNIGNRSPYARNTDNRSYKVGRSFMAYLDFRLASLGGLKKFLKTFFKQYNHKLVTTQTFINFLKNESKIDFTKEFNYHIRNITNDEVLTNEERKNVHHH